jgi:hypothetical protein
VSRSADDRIVRPLVAFLVSLVLALSLAGCSGSDTVALESVANAADRTQSSGSSRLAMELSMGMDGKRFDVRATGAFDYKRSRGWMEMDLGGLAVLTSGPALPRLRMLFEGDTIWMRVPPALTPRTNGRPWARMTAGTSALGTGMQQPDPAQMLDSLRGLSDSLSKVGRARVRGVETTHYRASVDLEKALSAAPAREREHAKAVLQLFGGLEQVPVELYIDDANRVRRMELKYEFELLDHEVDAEIRMELFDFGARVAFARPPASQVAELSLTH